MPTWKEKKSQAPKVEGPYPDLIARVLAARNLDSEQIKDLLNPQLSRLHDPYLLLGMRKAVDRLVQAYKTQEKICIYADFDLDGTSGLAILKNGLEAMGFQSVAFYQPRRLSEGYGFHAEAVEELKNLGISLIVTVDVGITSFKACEKAQELGVDVILTDHHLPAEKLPEAFVVVNPNQKGCTSGLGYLCGAGVAFYLLRALKRALSSGSSDGSYQAISPQAVSFDLKEVLEFFCIGTLTDMVPLVEDNRILVKHGLVSLTKTTKPGLKALLEALHLGDRELTSQDVAIRFAPKLNALSRMESDILPIQIYLETDSKKAQQMVSTVLENNQTRQTLQGDAESKALKMLDGWNEPDFVFVSSEFFHRGVVGLIATKLSQTFNRPAFVGSQNSEGMIVGSGRTPAGSEVSLVSALSFAEKKLNRFGGHAAAAGFELHQQNQEHVIADLKRYFQELKTHHQPLEIEFETTAELNEIEAQAMKWYDFLGPFGVGFHVPIVRLKPVYLQSKKELKGGHLKLSLSNAERSQFIDALLFSPTQKIVDQIQVGSDYEVLTELQWNYFRNNKTIQLLIKDLKIL